jgi:hypothetical protein
MIAPVLNQENQERWLSSAAELSKRELEKEIAREFPERQVQERIRYVSEERLELKLGISDDLHELLKRVRDLVSTQMGKSATLEETLRVALTLYVEKKDPMEKAKRAETKEGKTKRVETIEATVKGSESDLSFSDPKPVPGQVGSTRASQISKNTSARQNPRFIPAKLEHAVRLRYQGQCTFKTTQGARCTERRWLDIHHVKPLSEGGATTLENLTLICRGHHQVIHCTDQQMPMFKFG